MLISLCVCFGHLRLFSQHIVIIECPNLVSYNIKKEKGGLASEKLIISNGDYAMCCEPQL